MAWIPSEEGVDPGRVPKRKLYTGALMPAIGLGTFGSDHIPANDVAEAVKGAASVGYRHFDCASVYGKQDWIGVALGGITEGGVKRAELWVTSKLWNDKHSEGDIILSCKKSLGDLQLDYLDLHLLHWPFPNYCPGADPDPVFNQAPQLSE